MAQETTTAANEGAIADLGFNPPTASGETLARHLERRVNDILDQVIASAIGRAVLAEQPDPSLVRAILREIYLEIVMYQPDSIEAAVASIGQMPRSMPVALVDEMLHHQVEEFDHGEMALRSYVGMGGEAAFARARTQSPSAFAVAATWRNITHKRDPFLYLGAVYLFDGLTPLITDLVVKSAGGKGESAKGMEFVAHHATADIEHTAQIRELIVQVADLYPEARASIAYGFDYFAHVYPLPVWEAARLRAVESLGKHAVAAE
jgi:Iron-containing redox enzyme